MRVGEGLLGVDGLKFYPVEVLRKPFGWKDKRTVIRNLRNLGVSIRYKGGKHWFSLDELNNVFVQGETKCTTSYEPYKPLSKLADLSDIL